MSNQQKTITSIADFIVAIEADSAEWGKEVRPWFRGEPGRLEQDPRVKELNSRNINGGKCVCDTVTIMADSFSPVTGRTFSEKGSCNGGHFVGIRNDRL